MQARITGFDYPLWPAFLTVLWFFLIALWVFLLITAVLDILGRADVGGFAKVLWFLGIVLFPLVGVVVYMLLRGEKIAAQRRRRAAGIDPPFHESFDAGFRGTGGGSRTGVADELEKLADLNKRGIISDEEFKQQKARLLA